MRIHAHFGEDIDVAELARRVEISVSQLERDFVRLLGVPPSKYLTKVRFDNALELLASGVPIAQIAQLCGYPDQSAFTRRFRASVGMSPREYRRRLRG